MANPILYDTHVHTPLCKHAEGLPEAYASVAMQRGLAGVIITCHNPLPPDISDGVRMAPEQFDQYVMMVEDARSVCAGRTEVCLGLECDFLPGLETFLEEQTASRPFEYLLGSVHAQLGGYVSQFRQDDLAAFQRTYFEHLAQAAELRLFDCLGHPETIVVKASGFENWSPERTVEAFGVVVERIAATGIAFEINTSHAMGPVLRGMLKLTRRCDIPVVIGSDAHQPKRVAERFVEALDVAEEAGYAVVSFYRQRRRHDVPIGQARASLTGDHDR